MSITECITRFMDKIKNGKICVYNEFSLQHELGIYLRKRLRKNGFKVEFERNVSSFGIDDNTVKKEIDIVVYKGEINGASGKCAIELKYPRNGQYPEQMYAFIKDITFMEQLKDKGFSETFCLTLVDDPLFYSKEGTRSTKDIYSCFRSENKKDIRIKKDFEPKPDWAKNGEFWPKSDYESEWTDCGTFKYYLLTIGGEK